MMYVVLFALLGLCLACFREGVWTKYTPQDVARWQSEAAQAMLAPPLHHPVQTPPLTSALPGQNPRRTVRHSPSSQPPVEALELVA